MDPAVRPPAVLVFKGKGRLSGSGRVRGQADALEAAANAGCFVWFGESNLTHRWQPVDHGAGQLITRLIKDGFLEWMSTPGNEDKWDHGLPAQQARLLALELMTKAFVEYFKESRASWRQRLFDDTGAGLTVDGSRDNLVKIESLPQYKPPHFLVECPAEWVGAPDDSDSSLDLSSSSDSSSSDA